MAAAAVAPVEPAEFFDESWVDPISDIVMGARGELTNSDLNEIRAIVDARMERVPTGIYRDLIERAIGLAGLTGSEPRREIGLIESAALKEEEGLYFLRDEERYRLRYMLGQRLSDIIEDIISDEGDIADHIAALENLQQNVTTGGRRLTRKRKHRKGHRSRKSRKSYRGGRRSHRRRYRHRK